MQDADAFRVLDDNADGEIDRAEWRKRKMTIFYLLDRDGDRFLVPSEVPGLATSQFAVADRDHYGRISGYEFNQAEIMQADAADSDKTSSVSLPEFQAYRARLGGR